jgi:hypothetical protein
MLDSRYAALPVCSANAIAEMKEAVRRAGGCVAAQELTRASPKALRHSVA